MPESYQESCITCRFYTLKGKNKECHRRPPSATPILGPQGAAGGGFGVISYWPQVGEADWCGAWEKGKPAMFKPLGVEPPEPPKLLKKD